MKKDPKKETNQELNLYQKLQLIQSEIKELIRSEENKFQKYFYFDELQVLRLLKPLLAKYHLTLLLSDDENKDFLCEPSGNMWLVKYGKKCEVINSLNPEEKLIHYFWASALNQDPAKAKGSAETYAIKYFLSKFFLMPVKDEEDPDARPFKVITTPSKKEFRPELTTTLLNIEEKFDKNNNKYLLLETTDLTNNVFVFPYKLGEERWGELKVGAKYQFSLGESSQGLYLLVDFVLAN